MGWRSESSAFHCDPSLGSALWRAAQAAHAQDNMCWDEALWICMLRHLGAECGLVDDQQRTNLTQLIQQRPQALPPWLLSSRDVHDRLTVEGDQVFLGPSPGNRWTVVTWKAMQARQAVQACAAHQQQQQLDRLCRAGEELLTSCAGDTGFLLLQPPLPTQLLAQADTASMLALAQVCRGLRCASFELLRREHACLHGIHSAKGPAPPPYQPLQRLAHEQQQQQQEEQQPQQQCRTPGLHQRRVNRALSLLCGSPEAAAQQVLQHRARGSSSTTGDSPAASTADYVRTCGKEFDPDDVFSRALQLIPERLITRMTLYKSEGPLDDRVRCELFWVKPEHLPEALQLMEERRERVRNQRHRRELERLLEVARSAARLGCDLCLLQTVW